MPCGVGPTGCCGCDSVLVRAAALRALLWKSNVPGVARPPCIELKIAWEFGLGAGNIDPPPPGVRPVLSDDSFGVGKLCLNCSSKYPFVLVGPGSIAGLSGPDRNELTQPGVPPTPKGAGDVRLATDGSPVNLPGVSAVVGAPKDCSKGLGSSWKWALAWRPLK